MKNKLSKKEIKELRESKKKVGKYALKEFSKKLSINDLAKIAEALERIERKIDNAIRIANPVLDVKGYPVANLDWTKKIFSHKTKGNRE